MPELHKAYVYKNGEWVLIGTAGGGAAIVSVPEPPSPGVVGTFWINPTEVPGDSLTVDVLEAIRGQIIAPKAIDIDGPNTLYISTDADGTAKLSLRSDSAKAGKLDNPLATEAWVIANSSGIHVGPNPPVNSNTLWLDPQGATDSQPFVVSETSPANYYGIWINPKG